jgi:hypothetical protein
VIPDSNHVLRHIPGSKIDQHGKVDGSAFIRRQKPGEPPEDGLSVEWREMAGEMPATDQVAIIRGLLRLNVTGTHQLVELEVGQTRNHVKDGAAELGIALELSFKHDPLGAAGQWPADPCHSEIFGTPDPGHEFATAVGDLIAQCVGEKYPARSDR